MLTIYFISDAHLGIDSPEKENFKNQQLISFLQDIEKKADILIIVGDLFDFWFDYQWVIPRHHLKTIIALKRLTSRGVKIMYCIGNHDFWLGNFFQNDLNITIHRKPICLNIEKRRFFISHGDGINKKDITYRILKTILRSPVTAVLCRIMHPDLTFMLARWFSSLSRQNRPNHDLREPYVNYARQLFTEGFDFVIMGHTHDAMILQENDHTYVNTGEWMHQFTYAVYANGKLTLKQWKHKGSKENQDET
ncbi:UDP-2,3-diacylglucosamine diphosphatase [bacterium]|nr:UDP-2,3-diacylglucosamine diphosphatase [bacterium]